MKGISIMFKWYVVYSNDYTWYASTMNKASAKSWLNQLINKGYSEAFMETELAYSE